MNNIDIVKEYGQGTVDFIEDHVELLEQGKFTQFYEIASKEFPRSQTGVLTDLLLYCDIDPLTDSDDLTAIPNNYLRNSRITMLNIPNRIHKVLCGGLADSQLTRIVLPQGITELEEQAFFSSTELEEVKILGPVTEIPHGCFAFCRSLLVLEIPSSVVAIRRSAFTGLSKHFTIKYAGTMQEWETKVQFEPANEPIRVYCKVTVQCTDGDIDYDIDV